MVRAVITGWFLLATLVNLWGAESFWALRMGKAAQDLASIVGGYRSDSVNGVAVDPAGYVYITGNTQIPSGSSIGVNYRAFVGKISPDGSQIVFWKLIEGASDSKAIALDKEGNIVIAGSISGEIGGAPVFIPKPSSGWRKAFVAKLNNSGSAFLFAAYLGGNADTESKAVALDSNANIYVTGSTGSSDFPVTSPAFQKTFKGAVGTCGYGLTDAFVSKLSADGKALIYSSALGGSGCDTAKSISVDARGSAVVVGSTASADFPVSAGALQPHPPVTTDRYWSTSYVTKFSPAGDGVAYSSYFGGLNSVAGGVTVDSSGNVYIAISGDIALTPGAYDFGKGSAAIVKLDASDSSILYAARVGPSVANAIAVDGVGNAYVTGVTYGGQPVVAAFQPDFYGGTCLISSLSSTMPVGSTVCTDAFVAALNSSGSALLFSSYLTSGVKDGGNAITVDAQSNAYIAGFGPLTIADGNPASVKDGSAFLVKMGGNRVPPFYTRASITNGADFNLGLPEPGAAATIFCANLTGVSGVVQASGLALPEELSGVRVRVGNAPAPLYSVSDVGGQQQINFQVPFEMAGNDIEVSQHGVKAFVSFGTRATAPGLFTADGNGAVQHADYTLVSASSPANRDEVVTVYGTGLGVVEPRIPSGSPPPAGTVCTAQAQLTATVAGKAADVLFAGLTPGFVGLYQVNLRVPADASSGAQDLAVSLPPVQTGYDYSFYKPIYTRRDSKPVTIWIR